jgi:hypothetical protein
VKVPSKWFPLMLLLIMVCLWKDKKEIRVYKVLKFMLLRLIHDYYKFKVK